jgi:hypothetical protein
MADVMFSKLLDSIEEIVYNLIKAKVLLEKQ